MPLKGKEIVIAGYLTGWTHSQLAELLIEQGATVRKSCSPNTSLLIVGARPGIRAEKAEELNIPQLPEAKLTNFLAQTIGKRSPSTKQEELTELRGLLNKPQEESTWFSLYLLFDAWPESADLEVGITYAAQHLASWPPELRIAPESWLEDARMGIANPRMKLVRSLHAQSNILEFPPHNSDGITQVLSPTLGDLGLTTLLDSGYIDQVVHISLPAQEISDAGIEALSAHEGLTALRTLHLEGNTYTMKSMAALCDAPFVPQLESLCLQSPNLSRPEIETLRKAPTLQHIKALKLHQSIIESAWIGYDSDNNDRFEYYFYADGHVFHTAIDYDDVWDGPEDQWRQLGDQIVFSQSHGYVTYRGTMTDFEVIGNASNVVGDDWTWDWIYLPDGLEYLDLG